MKPGRINTGDGKESLSLKVCQPARPSQTTPVVPFFVSCEPSSSTTLVMASFAVVVDTYTCQSQTFRCRLPCNICSKKFVGAGNGAIMSTCICICMATASRCSSDVYTALLWSRVLCFIDATEGDESPDSCICASVVCRERQCRLQLQCSFVRISADTPV